MCYQTMKRDEGPKWKKPILKGYVLYDSNYMALGRKSIETVKPSLTIRGWMGREIIGKGGGSFRALYNVIRVGSCDHIFF
jgi:hypothetical protein